MKNHIFLLAAALAFTTTGHAQEEKAPRKWWQDIKQNTTFGGYVIGKAAFNEPRPGCKERIAFHV